MMTHAWKSLRRLVVRTLMQPFGAWCARGAVPVLAAAAAALAAPLAIAQTPAQAQAPSAAPAGAQGFPNRPIQIVVGFPAGSIIDVVTRVAAEHLRNRLGQPVVVINKPGANGVIAATEVARAAPDGYTLLSSNSSSMTVNHFLYRKLGYQPSDFTPVTMLTSAPLILVVNAQGDRTASMRTVADMVEFARAKPDEFTFAAGGPGNITGLTFKILANHANVKVRQVLYKSAAAAQLGLLGKEVDAFVDTPQAGPHVRAGKLTALAVTGPRRWRDLPDVPTLKEAGFPQVEVVFWLSLFAPAKTPPEIVDKLHGTLATLREDANLAKQLLPHGDIELMGPKEHIERIRVESAMWGEIIRKENLQLD